MKTTNDWQPISTAPRDGTHILIWDGHLIQIGYWCPIMGDWWGWDDCRFSNDPTHWMHLPAAPTEATP